MKVSIKLNVFFEGVFWVGVFEKTYEEKYEVSRVVFGAEPKDFEVYDFILREFYNLRFSNPISLESAETNKKKINPKRYQREIKKEVENKGIGTKAQMAIKQQQEEGKLARKKSTKQEKEEAEQRKFELRQEKKSEKHRGH